MFLQCKPSPPWHYAVCCSFLVKAVRFCTCLRWPLTWMMTPVLQCIPTCCRYYFHFSAISTTPSDPGTIQIPLMFPLPSSCFALASQPVFRWLRRWHRIVLGAQMMVKFWLRNETWKLTVLPAWNSCLRQASIIWTFCIFKRSVLQGDKFTDHFRNSKSFRLGDAEKTYSMDSKARKKWLHDITRISCGSEEKSLA